VRTQIGAKMALGEPFEVTKGIETRCALRMQRGKMRRSPISAVVATAVLLVTGAGAPTSFAAPGAPVLHSASAPTRRVLVTFTVGDLQPWLIEVAASSETEASGAFRPDAVRLREVITAKPDPSTGLVRWRTPQRLAPGAYFVHVSAIETDGITDCRPQNRDCLVHWSASRRLLIR